MIRIKRKEITKVCTFLKTPYYTNCLTVLRALEETGGMCVTPLAERLGLAQPVVSHALKILMNAGMVGMKDKDPYHFYSLNPGGIDRWNQIISDLQKQIKEI